LPIKFLAQTHFEVKLDMVNYSTSGKAATRADDDKAGLRDRIGSKGMVKLKLVYHSKASLPKNKAGLSLFESANLSKAYFPIRTLPFSIVYHVAIFCVVFYLQVTFFALENARLLEGRMESSRNEPVIVMFFPILGSDLPFEDPPAPKPEEQPEAPSKEPPGASAKEPESASNPGEKGLVYPGPQPIVSNPPDPTNQIQTLLQPALEDPEILAPPLSLPNIVQFADSSTAPKSELDIGPIEPPPMVEPPPPPRNPLDELMPREPRMLDIPPAKVDEAELRMPPVKVAPPSESDAPKLVVPSMVVSALEPPPPEPVPPQEFGPDITEEFVHRTLADNASPAPADPLRTGLPPQIAERREEAPLPQSSPLDRGGSTQEDILALTPIPAPIKLPLQIPKGEARGSFAISPEPNLNTSETEPGMLADVFSAEPGQGDRSAASSGDSASESGVRNIGFGEGSGSGESETSITVGFGSGLADNISVGSAPGDGAETGEGVSSGKAPFSGITMVGGSYDPGAAVNADPVVQASRPLQTSYGVTVISTENSGGGLPYVGVFSNEQIYTVYLDMREKESDAIPSWILEFALFSDSVDSAGVPPNPAESKEGLILPFPITKKLPDLPVDLVRTHLNELVIVYAVINEEGKTEQMLVKQSPEARLNELLLQALSEWVFRPAQLHGEPVPIKALLGIPLWLPKQTNPGIINLDIF
jgi:hypothetical protein